MKGKRYAISRFGSGSHLMAIVDAVQRGWDPAEIKFVKIGNLKGARAAMEAGEIWQNNNNKAFSFPLVGWDCGKGINNSESPLVFRTKPIADDYPCGTLMVADLSGFEAWSSEREPAQVFTLLETIFNSFDRIGKKRRIFNVEVRETKLF